MIEGLKVELESHELIEHLRERGEYHKERSLWYASQMDNLSQGGLMPEAVSADPMKALERKVKEHREKSGYLLFLADHVVLVETYRLTDVDLAKLEFVSRYF